MGAGCILWNKGISSSGYGRAYIGRKGISAHRLAWIRANGVDIPEGMCICHTCDVRACVNPDHLFLGTHSDNMQDMIKKGRKYNQQGENGNNAKLKNKDVRTIKKLLAKNYNRHVIANHYKVSYSTITDIALGRTWSHINLKSGMARVIS